jgi:hypothetical protein
VSLMLPKPSRGAQPTAILAGMTIATWILAIATLAIAAEGATALVQWTNRFRLGRTCSELEQLRRELALLHHAAWMDVSSQGQRYEVDDKVRAMLMLDGWKPNDELRAEVGDYSLSRIQEDIPGVTDT